MLLLASNVIGMPISSIRLSGKIGEITGLLLNPDTLKIVAFWVRIGANKDNDLLLLEETREFNIRGVIVDDIHNVASPDELTRLKEVLDINYEIPGKKVIGARGKLGTATDFSFDPESAEVMTIIGKPSLTKRFGQNEFTVHRRQIEEVTDSHIKINDGPSAIPLKQKLSVQERPAPDYPSSASDISE